MITLNIECEVPISKGLWQKAIEHAISLIGLNGTGTATGGSGVVGSSSGAGISVTLVDEKTITELAGKYRHDPRPTDVLAFSLDSEEGKSHLQSGQTGEVIVCPEVILRNAEKYKAPFSEELLRVIIHGLLHLKELDHEPYKFPLVTKGLKPEALKSSSYASAKKMFELQESLVKQLRYYIFEPKLIVGLGNAGQKYANTRHNAGFLFVDILLKTLGLENRIKYSARLAALENGFSKHSASVAKHGNTHFALPQGGMNVSGKAVSALCKYLKIDPRESLLVIHDDLDLRLGEHKISYGKGRLHKGIEDVERSLKTSRFWRLRLGADARSPQNREEGKEYVLKNFSAEERKIFDRVLAATSKEVAENIRLAT